MIMISVVGRFIFYFIFIFQCPLSWMLAYVINPHSEVLSFFFPKIQNQLDLQQERSNHGGAQPRACQIRSMSLILPHSQLKC